MKAHSKTSSAPPDAAQAQPRAVGEFSPGDTVIHTELGEGVLLRVEGGGYARAFFRAHGERQVLVSSLARAATWNEQVVASPQPATAEILHRLWLAVEAELRLDPVRRL